LINLYNAKKVPDASSPSGFCWNVTVPVYANNACANPNTPMTFASACMWRAFSADRCQDCLWRGHEWGRRRIFGTLGSIPGLVDKLQEEDLIACLDL
jgi:hypothetical protein